MTRGGGASAPPELRRETACPAWGVPAVRLPGCSAPCAWGLGWSQHPTSAPPTPHVRWEGLSQAPFPRRGADLRRSPGDEAGLEGASVWTRDHRALGQAPKRARLSVSAPTPAPNSPPPASQAPFPPTPSLSVAPVLPAPGLCWRGLCSLRSDPTACPTPSRPASPHSPSLASLSRSLAGRSGL